MTTYFATGPFPCFQGVILLSLSALLGLGQTALELGLINALTVLALFLSYSMLNVCDLSTDGCFTLGACVGAVVAISGHPYLAIPAAMLAGVVSGGVAAVFEAVEKFGLPLRRERRRKTPAGRDPREKVDEVE